MKKFYKHFLLLLFLFPNILFANDTINLLKRKIKLSTDTTRISLLLNVVDEFKYSNLDSAFVYANKAYSEVENCTNFKLYVKTKILYSILLNKKGKTDEALQIMQNVLDESIRKNNQELTCKIYNQISQLYIAINKYDNAIEFINKSLELCNQLKLHNIKAVNYNSLGIIYMERGNHETALNHYYKAYQLVEKVDQPKIKMSILLNMSTIYSKEGQQQKALNNLFELLKILEPKGSKFSKSAVYNNIGVIYTELKDNKNALKYLLKSIKIKEELNDKENISKGYNNIGNLHFTMGNNLKAIDYINRSLHINRELNYETDIIYNLENLASIYLKQKNYAKTNACLKEAIYLSRKLKLRTKESDILKLYAKYYNKTNQYKKAYQTLEQQNILSDSIAKISRSNKIASLQTQFETEQKEKENEILRVKNQLSQENLQKEKTTQKYLMLFSILAIILLILAFTLILSKIKINERIKRINGMLEDSNQKLKLHSITKDKFFSIIAHDLRAPFNAILGFSELIKNELNDDNPDKNSIKEFNKSVNESAQNLFALLENLLQWANNQRGELEYKPTKFDLYDLVISNIKIFSLKANNKTIDLSSDITPNTFVIGDENMVNTVIRNLISNALKFTKSNGKIVISTKTDGRIITICVKDTGIGISTENQAKLFRLDKNFTTHGTNNESGSGLGLILCKEFVEQNGGHIWVESQIKEGSKFKFTLKTA